MEHTLLKRKIMEHLEGLNELDKQTDTQTLIQVIAERYDTPIEIVEKTIAEWESGGHKA